jgi:hypothetical protein
MRKLLVVTVPVVAKAVVASKHVPTKAAVTFKSLLFINPSGFDFCNSLI